MQYQIVSTWLNGDTVRGKLYSDRSILDAWVNRMNAEYPDNKHFVSEVYPAKIATENNK